MRILVSINFNGVLNIKILCFDYLIYVIYNINKYYNTIYMPINYLFIILIMLFTKLNLYAISFNLQCNASNILSKYYTKQLTN